MVVLSPREVALRLRVSRTYVYWLARRGFLPGARRVLRPACRAGQRRSVVRWEVPEAAVAAFEAAYPLPSGVSVSLRPELVGANLAVEHERALRLGRSGVRWPS